MVYESTPKYLLTEILIENLNCSFRELIFNSTHCCWPYVLQIPSIGSHMIAYKSSEPGPIIEHNAAHTTLQSVAGKRTQEWYCSH